MTVMTQSATAHRIEQLLDLPAKRVACHLPTNHSYEVMLEIPGAGVELRDIEGRAKYATWKDWTNTNIWRRQP